ncbi:alpha/beta hydrolase [Metabacillus arenae]|uniref:Alpha/beta hydrolase n=1 Tax=Metabacillus arenae TaxID=2771434 RepID=A0A926N8H1_9BACI|nr:alpha/beta hydrolase [Metabacillus arenae]MBD1379402.1 alpha/beta hydrolase [Metabacillus arenae]
MTNLLWPDGAPFLESVQGYSPTISLYLADRHDKHGAVVIFPGGGYQHRAQHEGKPVARWLNNLGISAFVLNYRVSPYRHPAPLADAQRAIRYVRHYAKEWNIDKQKIGILGFSAGGHLASAISTNFMQKYYESTDKMDLESCRPDIAILCYPVISFTQHFHEGSILNLLGESSSDQLRVLLSSENNVSAGTPPTFLWHTANDASVPVENSLLYAQALSKNNIPYEMHIFPNGRHGLGLAEDVPDVGKWTELCRDWLIQQGF